MRKILAIIACMAVAGLSCSREPAAPTAPQSDQPESTPVPAKVQALLDSHAIDPDLPTPGIVSPLDVPSLTDTSYDVYAVTFLWGSFFPPDPGASVSPTDWSGKLWINAEAFIAVHALIDFERGQDGVVDEDVPWLAAWRSITEDDFDGLSFLVFVKRGNVYFAAPMLFYETEPIKLDFLLERLEKFDGFFPTGPWSGVAVHSRKLARHHCPHGTLSGRWVRDDAAAGGGHFEGVWADGSGNPVGPVAGRFWVTDTGDRLLEGVVSGGVTTQVIIFLKGTWWFDDPRMCAMCGGGHGRFLGRFEMADGSGGGKFGGEFGDWSLYPESLDMPFAGRWRFDCAGDATDVIASDQN